MTFKKIYIEITNVCNYSCSFCYRSVRVPEFMSVENFEKLVKKIRPYTDYIYLHILGEPLLHPQFAEIVKTAADAGLQINITTNGSLLASKTSELLSLPLRQINISLHAVEENIQKSEWDACLAEILAFVEKASSKIYINIRLWNGNGTENSEFNRFCIDKISEYYNVDYKKFTATTINNFTLTRNVFFDFAPQFEWPDGKTLRTLDNNKKCYALRNHIGILSDGRVVPCCLDADGVLVLGNIFHGELSEILNSPKAKKMANGFKSDLITEDFCKTCGFII